MSNRVERGYKNTSSSETVNVNKVSMPSKFIAGRVVDMVNQCNFASPSMVKSLEAYAFLWAEGTTFKFTDDNLIVAHTPTHVYLIGRGGGVTPKAILVGGEWKQVN